MQALLLLVILSTGFYYLGSRAVITSWLWSRYPPSIAAFMDCPACSGFWYGLMIGLLLIGIDRVPFDLPVNVITWLALGFVSMVLTPLGAATLHHAILVNGSAISESPPDEP